MNTDKKPCWKCKTLQTRYFLSILGFFAMFHMYSMRFNLSIALVGMVKAPLKERDIFQKDACPELKTNSSSLSKEQGEFDWDTKLQGLLLGALFYGMVVTPFPSSIISSKYGSKWTCGLSIFICGIFTLFSPLVARWNVWAFFVLRLMKGLALGIAYPAVHSLIGKWMPENERSRQSAFIYNGSNIGTISTFLFSGFIMDSGFLGGWPGTFYLPGITASVWFIFWVFLVYEKPSQHPLISEEELNNIRNKKKPPPETTDIPWKSLATSPPVYALIVAHFGSDWGHFTLLTEMPTYLAHVLHFDIKKNGMLSSVPYVMYCLFSAVSSVIADALRRLGTFKITTIRKIMNSVAFYCTGLCLLLIPYMGCRPVVIMTLLSLCSGFNGFKYSGFVVTSLDMSPRYAGIILGMTVTCANLTGILAPAFVGWLTHTGHTLENWKTVFLTAATVLFVTGTIFNIFASAEKQSWCTTFVLSDLSERNEDIDEAKPTKSCQSDLNSEEKNKGQDSEQTTKESSIRSKND